MSTSQKIYVFRCGASALYALTADIAGPNLPLPACPAGWRFKQSVTLRLDKSSPNHELIEATRAAIAKHGFYLTHAAVHGLPVLAEQEQTESLELAERLA
jgi:hypothetical protein